MRADTNYRQVLPIDFGLLLVLALPLIILIFNRSWIYNPAVTIDPWVYNGFFFRLKQYMDAFGGTYYASRLSWLLPGYLAYQLLPPIVANYVLHLGFYYLATISLYLILKFTVSPRIALFVTLLLGWYDYFLLAIGWDYVDGAGVAYYLLTTLMLTCSVFLKLWRLFLFLGGIACGATIYTNLVWVALVPALLCYYGVINRHRRNSLVASCLMFGLGFVFITVLLGFFNVAFNQPFLFFSASLSIAKVLVSRPNSWAVDWRLWYFSATWLLLPLYAFTSSVIGLVFQQVKQIRTQKSENINLNAFQLGCVLNMLAMVSIHLKGTPVLQHMFYISCLIPFTFLGIAAQLEWGAKYIPAYYFRFLIFAFLFLSGLSYVLPYNVFSLLPAVPFISLLLVCFLTKSRRYLLQKVIISLALSILFILYNSSILNWRKEGSINFVGPPDPTLGSKKSSNSYNPEEGFMVVMKTQAILKEIDPKVRLRFWYDLNESLVYRSISSSNLWGYRLIGEKFPDFQNPLQPINASVNLEQLRKQLAESPQIAILSNRSDAFQQAQRSLKQVGFDAELVSSYDIAHNDTRFTLTVIKISKMN